MHLLANFKISPAYLHHTSLCLNSQHIVFLVCHLTIKNIGFAYKSGYKLCLRMLINLHRYIQLFQNAIMHNRNPITHGQCLFLIMGNIDKCNSQFLLKTLQFNLHLLTQLQVKRTQRFIQKQYLRFVDQCSCNRHSLFLTAGKFIRLTLLKPFQLNKSQHLHDSFLNLRLWYFLDRQSVCYIIKNRHMWEQCIILENSIDVSLKRLLVFDTFAFDLDYTG